MIIKIGTSYNPESEGLGKYNEKAEILAEKLTKLLSNSSLYNLIQADEDNFYDKTFIIPPKYLEARHNRTRAKTLLYYLARQARKRNLNFILIVPQSSSKNYSDKGLDNLVEVYIMNEYNIPGLIEMFGSKKYPTSGVKNE